MDSKVFWGVLCALLVFSGIMWLLFALGIVGLRAAADEASRQAVVELQQQAANFDKSKRENQRVQLARRQLTGDQRCIGGVVILVNGSSYRQLGSVGDPVRCSGQLADRPIR